MAAPAICKPQMHQVVFSTSRTDIRVIQEKKFFHKLLYQLLRGPPVLSPGHVIHICSDQIRITLRTTIYK